ncbi:hypothetical protein LR004_00960 [Candidatus Gracilibacteria bacterium]|nr:hypothetical protein [Candidatus Gracilibacteria bacterium]
MSHKLNTLLLPITISLALNGTITNAIESNKESINKISTTCSKEANNFIDANVVLVEMTNTWAEAQRNRLVEISFKVQKIIEHSKIDKKNKYADDNIDRLLREKLTPNEINDLESLGSEESMIIPNHIQDQNAKVNRLETIYDVCMKG